jgi:hypothetical protein
MAYDRTNTGPWTWVKTVGSVDDPLLQDWLGEREGLLEKVWFPKHPRSIRRGDLLVYYAATRGRFPAVVEVKSDEVRRRPEDYSERWPWYMEVRPRLVIPYLDCAPDLADVGLDPLRLRRQSHILLTDDEWERCRRTYLPPHGQYAATSSAI